MLKSNRDHPHQIKLALLLGFVFGGIFIVRAIDVQSFSRSLPWDVVLRLAIYWVIIAPWIEELWFRSFIYRGFRKKHGIAISVCGSSILFTGYHLLNFGWPIIILGPLLALYYEKTGSFSGCVIAHSTGNLISLLFILFMPMII